MTTNEDIDTTISVAVLPGQPVAVPSGTVIVSTSTNTATIQIDYDYGPFEDPESPAFEFVGDSLEVNPEGQIVVVRDVVYLSLPGRSTVKKEV